MKSQEGTKRNCVTFISSGADAAYGEGRLLPPYPNSTPQNVRIPTIASRVDLGEKSASANKSSSRSRLAEQNFPWAHLL